MFDPPLWNKEMIHNCDASVYYVNNLWGGGGRGGLAKFLFLLTWRGVHKKITNYRTRANSTRGYY